MSTLKSRVGGETENGFSAYKMVWKSIPRGNTGVALLEIASTLDGKPQTIEVRWRLDAEGIWLLLPHGLFGFDLNSERDESGEVLYQVSQRGQHANWKDLRFSHGDANPSGASASKKVKASRIRAQMPGKIIRVLVEPGQLVQKDQSTVVMEAMKMENEIRAPQTGHVKVVHVSVGQNVETGADLLAIEPEGAV